MTAKNIQSDIIKPMSIQAKMLHKTFPSAELLPLGSENKVLSHFAVAGAWRAAEMMIQTAKVEKAATVAMTWRVT